MWTDTSPEVQRVWVDLWRQKTPTFRLERALNMTATVRNLSWQGLCEAYPHLSEGERRLKFIELTYGHVLAQKLRHYEQARDDL